MATDYIVYREALEPQISRVASRVITAAGFKWSLLSVIAAPARVGAP